MTYHSVQPGDTIQIGGVVAASTPPEMRTWLSQRGWVDNGGNEDLWRHEPKGRYNMRWEQAIACEFFEFITLGGR